MNFYIKKLDSLNAEAWVEDFISNEMGWKVTSIAKLILRGDDQCLIDSIKTPFPFRKKGYATKIVNSLLERFKSVEPIGVLHKSQGFWDKFNMKDALGQER